MFEKGQKLTFLNILVSVDRNTALNVHIFAFWLIGLWFIVKHGNLIPCSMQQRPSFLKIIEEWEFFVFGGRRDTQYYDLG